MAIKAVISDVGGVLVHFDAARHFASVARLCRTTPEAVADLLGTPRLCDGVHEALWRAASRGVFNPAEIRATVTGHFGVTSEQVPFERAWTSGFVGITLGYGIVDAVRRKYGLPLISCTDVDPIYGKNEHAQPLFDDYFDREVQSWEVGALKPDPRMYARALGFAEELAGARPHECLFIDDCEENVAGARRAGLPTIHYTDGNPLYFGWQLSEHGLVAPP